MSGNAHPEDVKAEVRKSGISLAELGRTNGIADSTVRKALYRPQPSGNRVIAERLNKSLHELWPEWFDETGQRLSSRVNKPSTGAVKGHSQKRGAA